MMRSCRIPRVSVCLSVSLRVWVVIVGAATVVAVAGVGAAVADSHRRDQQGQEIALDLFERVNDERAARGYHRLEWDAELAAYSTDWSAEMADRGQVGHSGVVDLQQRFDRYNSIAENVVMAHGPDPSHVGARMPHITWMGDAGHRNVLLDQEFDATGLGVACRGDQVYATQVFGRYADASRRHVDSPPPPDEPPEPLERDDPGPRCADEPSDPVAGVTRLAGDERIATAAAVADRSHPDGADAAVVARADDPFDALAGGALAAAVDGPLLLTGRDTLHDASRVALERLEPDTVYLMGGTAALSEGVGDDARRVADTVERVAGATRFATAGEAARVAADEAGDAFGSPAFVVGGDAWPDAVAATHLAAIERAPVLLAANSTATRATLQALRDLDSDRVWVVGGTGTVPPAVTDELAATGLTVDRIAGSTRYATAHAAYDRAVDWLETPGDPWFATVADWPDSLAAGAAAAEAGSPLALVDGHDPRIDRVAEPLTAPVTVVGGPSAITERWVSAKLE